MEKYSRLSGPPFEGKKINSIKRLNLFMKNTFFIIAQTKNVYLLKKSRT